MSVTSRPLGAVARSPLIRRSSRGPLLLSSCRLRPVPHT